MRSPRFEEYCDALGEPAVRSHHERRQSVASVQLINGSAGRDQAAQGVGRFAARGRTMKRGHAVTREQQGIRAVCDKAIDDVSMPKPGRNMQSCHAALLVEAVDAKFAPNYSSARGPTFVYHFLIVVHDIGAVGKIHQLTYSLLLT